MSAQIRLANGSVPAGGLHESVYVSTCSWGGASSARLTIARTAYTVTETRLLPSPAAVPATPTSSTSMQPSTVTRLIASTIRRWRAHPFHHPLGATSSLDSS